MSLVGFGAKPQAGFGTAVPRMNAVSEQAAKRPAIETSAFRMAGIYFVSPSVKLRPRAQSNWNHITLSVMQPASCGFRTYSDIYRGHDTRARSVGCAPDFFRRCRWNVRSPADEGRRSVGNRKECRLRHDYASFPGSPDPFLASRCSMRLLPSNS